MSPDQERYFGEPTALFIRNTSSPGQLLGTIRVWRLRSSYPQEELSLGIQDRSKSDPRIRRKNYGPTQKSQVCTPSLFVSRAIEFKVLSLNIHLVLLSSFAKSEV